MRSVSLFYISLLFFCNGSRVFSVIITEFLSSLHASVADGVACRWIYEGCSLQSLLCAMSLLIDRGRERERKGMEKGRESAEAHIGFRMGKILTVRFPMPEKDPNCLIAKSFIQMRDWKINVPYVQRGLDFSETCSY